MKPQESLERADDQPQKVKQPEHFPLLKRKLGLTSSVVAALLLNGCIGLSIGGGSSDAHEQVERHTFNTIVNGFTSHYELERKVKDGFVWHFINGRLVTQMEYEQTLERLKRGSSL